MPRVELDRMDMPCCARSPTYMYVCMYVCTVVCSGGAKLKIFFLGREGGMAQLPVFVFLLLLTLLLLLWKLEGRVRVVYSMHEKCMHACRWRCITWRGKRQARRISVPETRIVSYRIVTVSNGIVLQLVGKKKIFLNHARERERESENRERREARGYY